MSTVIHWFRRDLRVGDNPALAAAAQASAGHVIPVFILDDCLLRSARMGAARVSFLLDALRALDGALRERGSRLVLRHGTPHEILPRLAQETDATTVYWNRDYTPFAVRRDEQVAAALDRHDIGTETSQDLVIYEPDAIVAQSGKPYSVYGPYRRQWRARVEQEREQWLHAPTLPQLQALPSALTSDSIPSVADLGFDLTQTLPPAGEAAGSERLAEFAKLRNRHGISRYDEQRDRMAAPATSRLSPYLHFGCVATASCLRAALLAAEAATGEARDGVETWLAEIAWHDFYMQVLFHFPHVLQGAFKPQYDGLEWENDEQLFAAWCDGRTGYPVVDAAMRQLNSEGWMHNRARMIVASFLTKDLLIDWRWGERYFLQQLVDGDNAANNGGWQWVAGTGTDPQPYFRIFNPISQGKKFDPQGEYVRRYVPELNDVPDKYIHAPWTMPEQEQQRIGIVIGRAYPQPVVDHKAQRERALAMYKAAAQGKGT